MVVTVTAVGALVLACGGTDPSADGTLCAEVQRVVDELADLEVPVGEVSGPDVQAYRVLASHLVVAAGGDPDGTPTPELATVVRRAGMAGTSQPSTTEFLAGLEASHDACADLGIALDRRSLDAVGGR
ncbi:hypothetical protein [Egicoccus halophilus]|uniref:Uncharacterized protein n=1 Tax=Egicoccus halophilus TaxID=1670830 RepID=A0A8J3A7Z0_9ACTN|nr:hypothetical protein [Egicoccus halophilus]GGI06238.1 hypothetical protein GCM10011354_18090 [Egicoccus halophilus]